jgi:uncharacterized protein YndB with AHSA1/START domain
MEPGQSRLALPGFHERSPPGGKFSSTMAAKDGSFSFDFWGIYDEVDTHKKIVYTMGDGRKADVLFTNNENDTRVTIHL